MAENRMMTVEQGLLEHLKKGKDDAKAELALLEDGFRAAQANADHYRRKNEVLAAEVEAYRASFLEALQHIENAILASHGTALPLRVVRKYLNRYEMESE